jgi:hypothetical protein
MHLLYRILLVCFVIIIWSCAKDRTCNCTITQTDSGTRYWVDYSGTNPVQKTEAFSKTISPFSNEVKFSKIRSAAAQEYCPVSVTQNQNYDDTYDLASGNESMLIGNKGSVKTIRSCELTD